MSPKFVTLSNDLPHRLSIELNRNDIVASITSLRVKQRRIDPILKNKLDSSHQVGPFTLRLYGLEAHVCLKVKSLDVLGLWPLKVMFVIGYRVSKIRRPFDN